MKKIEIFGLACVLAVPVYADQTSAFQDANTFAGSTTAGSFSGITSGGVTDKIPGYGTAPSETQYYQGGQGALSGPGIAKVQNCSNYTPGQNKVANQECEAVNFLARNPNVRPQFNIGANDPMVLGAKESRKNAESFFQSLGIGSETGSSTQCTTKTTTTPAQYTTETCTSLRAIEGQQCTVGRVVNIDADANYQCDKTLTAFTSQQRQPTVSTSSCAYGRQVNIDEDSRFQCDQTVSAYETIKCKKTYYASISIDRKPLHSGFFCAEYRVDGGFCIENQKEGLVVYNCPGGYALITGGVSNTYTCSMTPPPYAANATTRQSGISLVPVPCYIGQSHPQFCGCGPGERDEPFTYLCTYSTTYSCNGDDALVGASCYPSAKYSDPTVVITCDAGYEHIGSVCVKKSPAQLRTWCDDGYTPTSDVCIKVTKTPYLINNCAPLESLAK